MRFAYSGLTTSSTTVENQSIDYHDFQITDNDTALFTVYNFLDNDIISGVVQELNISTGEALFTWDSIDHIPTSDCYIAKADGPWDYIVSLTSLSRPRLHLEGWVDLDQAWNV